MGVLTVRAGAEDSAPPTPRKGRQQFPECHLTPQGTALAATGGLDTVLPAGWPRGTPRSARRDSEASRSPETRAGPVREGLSEAVHLRGRRSPGEEGGVSRWTWPRCAHSWPPAKGSREQGLEEVRGHQHEGRRLSTASVRGEGCSLGNDRNASESCWPVRTCTCRGRPGDTAVHRSHVRLSVCLPRAPESQPCSAPHGLPSLRAQPWSETQVYLWARVRPPPHLRMPQRHLAAPSALPSGPARGQGLGGGGAGDLSASLTP